MFTQTTKQLLPPAKKGQPWPVQGYWTYEDYLRLPEDGRCYEIIEGVLYMANAPSYEHQFTTLELATQIKLFVDKNKLGRVLTAPFEVHLPGIAKPVQPDVLFITSERQLPATMQIFEGAPDLIVEVVSPGSVRLDQHIKFGAYERAGVREYWIADPKTHSVAVYILPPGGLEYVLLGQFTANETLHSDLLTGLQIEVNKLFVI